MPKYINEEKVRGKCSFCNRKTNCFERRGRNKMEYQAMKCKNCKHYESYHQYPNPNAVAKHYCTKCNEEIEYIKTSYCSNVYIVWLPKGCYLNDYFEPSEEYLKRQKEKYITGLLGCQIED